MPRTKEEISPKLNLPKDRALLSFSFQHDMRQHISQNSIVIKILITCIFILVLFTRLHGQEMQAKIEVDHKIEGLCDQDEFYCIFEWMGNQQEAKCPIDKNELFKRLSQDLDLANKFPKFKGADGVFLSINCKGQIVEIESEFKNEEINKIIINFFNSLGNWKPARMRGKEVDSGVLYSIKIKKGILTVNGLG